MDGACHPAACEKIVRGRDTRSVTTLSSQDAGSDRLDETFEGDRPAASRPAAGIRHSSVGYRAPSGKNFPEASSPICQTGIRFSSSFPTDILPYRHASADGVPGPVEIPVNFAFDDWNFGMSSRSSARPLFGREAVLSL